MKGVDLTNLKFGRLTAVSPNGKTKHNKITWLCKCDCGKLKTVISGNLKSGTSNSCGCLMMEQNTKHGDHKTAFYNAWRDLKFRCNAPSSPEYHNYGGRGVKVCKEWNDDYLNFKNDMFDSYVHGLSIDRINVDGDYCKENCRWATNKEQCNNMRKNVRIDTPWGLLTLSQAAESAGLSKECFAARRRKGLTGEALFAPVTRQHSRKNK